jgi:hypothetical protein
MVKGEFSSEGLTLGDALREKVDYPAQALDVCRQEYHFCLRKALQDGLVTGATDGSMPVGSGRVFIHFSSIYRTTVLLYSDLLLAKLSCLSLTGTPIGHGG